MNFLSLVKKKKLSQSELAALLSINQSTVSKAIAAGVITPRADWLTQVREYVSHAIEVAAGRRPAAGELDLIQERARLSKLQADRIAMELKQKRGELLHIDSTVLGVSEMISITRTHLLALPSKLKSRFPQLSPGDVSTIRDEVYDCLTNLSRMKIPEDVMNKMIATEDKLWGDIGEDPNGKETNHG